MCLYMYNIKMGLIHWALHGKMKKTETCVCTQQCEEKRKKFTETKQLASRNKS